MVSVHAADDAELSAVGDVAGGPEVNRNVLEGSDGGLQSISLVLTKKHISYDLGGLSTVVGGLGDDLGVGAAIDDAETGQDAYGLDISVADFPGVGIAVELIVSGSADNTETENHHERQYERQRLLESSHVETPPLNSTPNIFRGPNM